MIYGTDVSGYQPINFLLELPGTSTRKVDFAIIKITEGVSYTNPKWTGQRQWARDHGLSVGFYHFARPGSMTAQADYFLSRVALQPGDHLWFDWEDAGISSTQKDQWIRYVQAQRPGHRVGLYCNTSFWKTRDQSSFAGDGLWIATGGIPQGQPPISSPWLIHQFSTEGSYDHDLAQFGSRAEMIAWANGNEEDMALTNEDVSKVAAAVVTALTGTVEGRQKLVGAIFRTDNVVDSPEGEGSPNPHWWVQSYLRESYLRLEEILAQGSANGAALTEVKNILSALDLSGLPEDIAAKLATLRFKFEDEGV